MRSGTMPFFSCEKAAIKQDNGSNGLAHILEKYG
jgi:hypothetical protein